jgi:hypothetical protein
MRRVYASIFNFVATSRWTTSHDELGRNRRDRVDYSRRKRTEEYESDGGPPRDGVDGNRVGSRTLQMEEHAIVAGRRETVTPWVAQTVSALGYEVAGTATADSPEDGRYYLPPGVVERAERLLDRTGAPLLVVDGEPHVGQLADLRERFPDIALRDRRSAVWARLAASNPVADDRLALRRARLERRLAERAQRQGSAQSPEGTGGRVADLERQCDQRRDRLSDRQQRARDRVTGSHTDADAYVVMAHTVGASSGVDRGLLLAQDRTPADTEAPPLRAETDVAGIGVHDVATTDIPAVPWTGGVPDWFEAVVPGALAALERATLVCSGVSDLAAALADRFDAAPVTAERPTEAAVRRALCSHLETTDLDVSLPYTDEAHALVSRLHDQTEVRRVAYGDRIDLSVTAPADGADAIERRIQGAGGRVERPSEGRDGEDG